MIFACQLTKESCRRNPPCEPHLPCRLAQRFAKLFSQLSEPTSVAAAVTAMNDLLASEKLSFSDVANVLEKKRYSAEDMQFVFDKGKEVVTGREVGAQPALEFFDIDGNPRWYEMAVFCQDKVGRLHNAWEKNFITDIAGKMLEREPTFKQAQCIIRIYVKLGGRCDPRARARYFSC